jgi:hypothetical protein
MLRDSHSLSFARPQVFPQAPPLLHSGAATRPPRRWRAAPLICMWRAGACR